MAEEIRSATILVSNSAYGPMQWTWDDLLFPGSQVGDQAAYLAHFMVVPSPSLGVGVIQYLLVSHCVQDRD